MKPIKQNRGFTLPELIVTSGISAFAMVGVLGLLLFVTKTAELSLTEATALMENTEIQRQMERDFRGITNVLAQSPDQFRFVTVEPDGTHNTIEYSAQKNGSDIELTRKEVTGLNIDEVLLSSDEHGISSARFEYYNQLGAAATTMADTNAVSVLIERSIDTGSTQSQKNLELIMMMFRNKTYSLGE